MKTKKIVKRLQEADAVLEDLLNGQRDTTDDALLDMRQALALATAKLNDQRDEMKQLKAEMEHLKVEIKTLRTFT